MSFLEKNKAHLASVNESYFQHMRFAFRYGFTCLAAGLMALVHGVMPAFFETTASNMVKRLAGMPRAES